ncbi:MAG TPA: class IV adenylate cyclase [Flavisolibacter sp.]|nr:class IV adenylate cyclase [Flavisolibacter sp.]
MHINYEFKARREVTDELEAMLQPFHPRFAGTDHQVDTYFNVPNGRLKLREGNIEHALIYYERHDAAAARQSDVTLYHPAPNPALKQVLEKSLGIKVVVDKTRKIYFIDNVKFHFDDVKDLGRFVEVEAIDKDGTIGIENLKEQCNVYAHLFRLTKEAYIAGSYSDLLLAKKSSTR